jgi:hypothetical protein
MERLLCCLLGFPEKDAQVLRSLAKLFRPSLSADWAFEVGLSEDCDLLVCDLDEAGGRHAWNSPAPPGLLRAAASANDVEDAGALLLRKPLRGHGPSGIVQVLNAAAAIKRPGLAPPHAPAGAAAAAAPAPAKPAPAPSAFFKPEATARPAPVPAPPPVAQPPRSAASHPHAPETGGAGLAFAERDATVEATKDEAHDAPVAGAADAQAASLDEADERAAEASVDKAPSPAVQAPEPEPAPAQPAWASEAAQEAEPTQDEANIKDILRRMRFATLGTAAEARTMLAALRDLRGQGKPAVLEAPGLKSICVVPQARAWFCTGPAPEIFGWLGEGNRPVRVLPFADTDEARDAAGCKDEPARPLDQLMWLACVRTPPEGLAPYETALFRLKRWPDLGNLPHEPHHMHWCGILTRQRAPLHALAKSGGVPPAQTAAFLDACGELGILERAPASPEEIAAVTLPEVSKKGRERISLFKNILGRLRLFRS